MKVIISGYTWATDEEPAMQEMVTGTYDECGKLMQEFVEAHEFRAISMDILEIDRENDNVPEGV